jgi:O-antigen/teichoic acid export membrane protein
VAMTKSIAREVLASRDSKAGPDEVSVEPNESTVQAHQTRRSFSPSRSVARGALALLSTQPITWLASLLTTAFLPRYLGDGDLGQYTVALTIAGLAGTVLSLGITMSMVRSVAAQPGRAFRDGPAALVLLVGLAIPVAIALALAGPLLGFGVERTDVLALVLAGMVITTAQSVLYSVLVGQQRHARFAWINAVSALITAIAGISVLVASGSLAAFVAVGLVVSSVALILGWQRSGLGFERSGISLPYFRTLIRDGFPFLGTVVATRLRGDIETTLLAVLVGNQAVGWLAAANRIVAVPLFIPTLIITPLLPALSQCADDRSALDRAVRRSLGALMILMLPISALIVAIAPAIPSFLGWSPSFWNSVLVMQVLGLTMPLIGIGMVLATALIAIGRERHWLGVNIAATGLGLGLNLLAIPAFDVSVENGAVGASIVRVLTEFVMIGGALILLPRGLLDRATVLLLSRIVLASACLAVAAACLVPVSPIVAVAGGALTYIVTLLLLRVVRLADAWRVRSMALDALARRRGAVHT